MSLKKHFNCLTLIAVVAIIFVSFSSAHAGEYVVKSGDTLSEIADAYGLSSNDLIKANGFSKDHFIQPGDVIYIPVSNSSSNSSYSGYGATVNANDVNLRQGPSRQDSVLCSLKKGEKVEILEDRGEWCYVRLSDGYEGWIAGQFLGSSSSGSSQKSSQNTSYVPQHYIAKTYTCSDGVNVRSKPSTGAGILCTVDYNEKIYVLDYRGDWIYVALKDGSKGWMYYDYLSIYHGQPSLEKKEKTTTNQVAKVEKKKNTSKQTKSIEYSDNQVSSTPHNTGLSSRGSGIAASIVQLAYTYMGVPYVWGGTSPNGFDCSGFVQTVYSMNGISIDRTADAQFNQGVSVSKEELRLGDLVFFTTYTYGASHVGIYIGDSQFIHASSGSGCVTVSSLQDDYYKARYIGGRRFF